MTQHAAPIIETHRLSDVDAQGVERQAGCIMAEITGNQPVIQPLPAVSFGEACLVGASLARDYPGHTFAVFKPAVTYSLETVTPSPAGEVPG